MFFKRPNHRIFDYQPRFYDPDTDEDERRKRRLGFKRRSKALRKKRNPLIWLLFIIVVLFIYLKLSTAV